MTARSRIRRMPLATLDRSEIQAVPDLQLQSKVTAIPAIPKGGLFARSRIRRAFLSHLPVDGLAPPPASEVERKADTKAKEARMLL
jgi:hypothetical protein